MKRLLRGGALLILFASAAAFLAPWNWLADLLVNFRVQYVFFGLCLAVALTLLRDLRAGIAALVGAGLSLPAAWAAIVPAAAAPMTMSAGADSGDRKVRALAANLLFLNDEHAKVLRWALGVDADVLVFMEVTDDWARALAPLQDRYPHMAAQRLTPRQSVRLYSRWPLVDTGAIGSGNGRPAGLHVRVQRGAASFEVLAVHAMWPLTPGRASLRARQLDVIARLARHSQLPLIVLGDLNTTEFSPAFVRMLAAGGLTDLGAGRGWQPTWPAPLPPLGLRIDHALAGRGVHNAHYRRDSIPGSDHKAVIVDVVVSDGQV